MKDNYRTANTFPDLEIKPFLALMQILIPARWSAEFDHYISMDNFSHYVHDDLVRFGLQVTGIVLGTALFAVPILGAIGFSSIEPIAGSATAGWRASIGAVEAGSLFALCQSVAMGGAAGLVTGTGVGGAALALAAAGLPSPSSLRGVFIQRFREGN